MRKHVTTIYSTIKLITTLANHYFNWNKGIFQIILTNLNGKKMWYRNTRNHLKIVNTWLGQFYFPWLSPANHPLNSLKINLFNISPLPNPWNMDTSQVCLQQSFCCLLFNPRHTIITTTSRLTVQWPSISILLHMSYLISLHTTQKLIIIPATTHNTCNQKDWKEFWPEVVSTNHFPILGLLLFLIFYLFYRSLITNYHIPYYKK